MEQDQDKQVEKKPTHYRRVMLCGNASRAVCGKIQGTQPGGISGGGGARWLAAGARLPACTRPFA